MVRFIGVRLQTTVVIVRFLASLATVTVVALQTIYLPQGEEQIQNRLAEASRRMAEAAYSEMNDLGDDPHRNFEAVGQKRRPVDRGAVIQYEPVGFALRRRRELAHGALGGAVFSLSHPLLAVLAFGTGWLGYEAGSHDDAEQENSQGRHRMFQYVALQWNSLPSRCATVRSEPLFESLR